ncbi:MAG: enoyl-CoA hydratase-related protein [Chloroflexi bacterium]|nr:enoyl-CoA hydratase-related protein [Chloroflexota bacterium]
MAYETVKLIKEDKVATIMFDRMKKKNAANHQVFRDLDAALTDIEQDDEMRVVVLTGQEDVFCAGADVSGFDFQKVSQGMYFMQDAHSGHGGDGQTRHFLHVAHGQ